MKNSVLLACAIGLAVASAPALYAQDATAGKKVFRQCASCHQIGEKAKNRVGPVLTGVVGRRAGTYEGYRYSKSMTAAGKAGLVWSTDRIVDYLAGPTAFLRAYLKDPKASAKMKFSLKRETDRRNVAAYLATFSAAAATEPGGTPETTSPRAMPPLAEALAGEICVQNRSSQPHLFAVDARDAGRHAKTLAPGEIMCGALKGAETGIVSVFDDPDAQEGCSRLVPEGKTEGLIEYADFDRCRWLSNG